MKRDRQQAETSIISIEKHNHNYSLIDNTGLRDSSLSYKATGLWAFLISHPPDWQISVSHLAKSKTDGRDSVLSGLYELHEAGYLLYLRWRDVDGLMSSRYIVFEHPQLKERYLERMTEEDKARIASPSSPAKAKAESRKTTPSTTDNPTWNHNGQSVMDKPRWTNRDGQSEQTNNIYTNSLDTNDLIPIKDPPTPQGGTGTLSQELGTELKQEELGNQDSNRETPTTKEAPKEIPFEQPKPCSEDQKSPASTPIFSVHKKEHQDRITQIYNSHKPKAWQPLNNLHRAIRVQVDNLLSSEDFGGDLETFLTRLENALLELQDPSSKFSWFTHQGNLGLSTLLSNYGKHLFEFSDAWTARQNPQTQQPKALPDWALQAQAEIEAKKLKKAV